MMMNNRKKLGCLVCLATLLSCASAAHKKSAAEKPGPVGPPIIDSVSCDDELFWPDSALTPLVAQLRKKLPQDSEYWIGTVESTVVCQVLRPSCSESEYLNRYFALMCPDAVASVYLDAGAESARKLSEICQLKDTRTFHRCQESLTGQLLQKSFISQAERTRFYTLKSE